MFVLLDFFNKIIACSTKLLKPEAIKQDFYKQKIKDVYYKYFCAVFYTVGVFVTVCSFHLFLMFMERRVVCP